MLWPMRCRIASDMPWFIKFIKKNFRKKVAFLEKLEQLNRLDELEGSINLSR
jgi:hypothetical protein